MGISISLEGPTDSQGQTRIPRGALQKYRVLVKATVAVPGLPQRVHSINNVLSGYQSTSPNISSRRSCVPLPIPQRCVTFGTHRSSVRGERKGEDCSRGVSVCLCLWPSSSVSMQLFIHFAGQAGRMPEPRLRSTRQKVSHTTLLRGQGNLSHPLLSTRRAFPCRASKQRPPSKHPPPPHTRSRLVSSRIAKPLRGHSLELPYARLGSCSPPGIPPVALSAIAYRAMIPLLPLSLNQNNEPAPRDFRIALLGIYQGRTTTPPSLKLVTSLPPTCSWRP